MTTRLAAAALALALASTTVHAVGAVRGGDHGLLYLFMATTCTACAVMTLRKDRIGDWLVMGVVNAGMVSAHLLLMSGMDASMAHMSTVRHLTYHAHGHGFDVAHLGGGLALLETVLCLYVLTSYAAATRPRPPAAPALGAGPVPSERATITTAGSRRPA